MEAWLNFAIVGLAELLLFIICAFVEKRLSEAPRLLFLGILIGIPLGLVSDLVLRGTYSYPLGYSFPYLLLNAAVVYGLFAATVLLLQKVPLLRFVMWNIAMVVVYEITNYFFPAWFYEIKPLLGLFAFVLVGYFATAVFIALISHLFLGYKFKFLGLKGF